MGDASQNIAIHDSSFFENGQTFQPYPSFEPLAHIGLGLSTSGTQTPYGTDSQGNLFATDAQNSFCIPDRDLPAQGAKAYNRGIGGQRDQFADIFSTSAGNNSGLAASNSFVLFSHLTTSPWPTEVWYIMRLLQIETVNLLQLLWIFS